MIGRTPGLRQAGLRKAGSVDAAGSGASIAYVDAGDAAVLAVASKAFLPSGSSHAIGAVPDPGAVAGATKFLREDSTWQVPPAGGGSSASPFAKSTADPATFTGLLGDEAKLIRYDIDFCFEETGNGYPRFRINADAGNNYGWRTVYSSLGGALNIQSAALASLPFFGLGFDNMPAGRYIGRISIPFPGSGKGLRQVMWKCYGWDSSTGNQTTIDGGGTWSNSASQITSVSIYFVNTPDSVQAALTPVYAA